MATISGPLTSKGAQLSDPTRIGGIGSRKITESEKRSARKRRAKKQDFESEFESQGFSSAEAAQLAGAAERGDTAAVERLKSTFKKQESQRIATEALRQQELETRQAERVTPLGGTAAGISPLQDSTTQAIKTPIGKQTLTFGEPDPVNVPEGLTTSDLGFLGILSEREQRTRTFDRALSEDERFITRPTVTELGEVLPQRAVERVRAEPSRIGDIDRPGSATALAQEIFKEEQALNIREAEFRKKTIIGDIILPDAGDSTFVETLKAAGNLGFSLGPGLGFTAERLALTGKKAGLQALSALTGTEEQREAAAIQRGEQADAFFKGISLFTPPTDPSTGILETVTDVRQLEFNPEGAINLAFAAATAGVTAAEAVKAPKGPTEGLIPDTLKGDITKKGQINLDFQRIDPGVKGLIGKRADVRVSFKPDGSMVQTTVSGSTRTVRTQVPGSTTAKVQVFRNGLVISEKTVPATELTAGGQLPILERFETTGPSIRTPEGGTAQTSLVSEAFKLNIPAEKGVIVGEIRATTATKGISTPFEFTGKGISSGIDFVPETSLGLSNLEFIRTRVSGGRVRPTISQDTVSFEPFIQEVVARPDVSVSVPEGFRIAGKKGQAGVGTIELPQINLVEPLGSNLIIETPSIGAVAPRVSVPSPSPGIQFPSVGLGGLGASIGVGGLNAVPPVGGRLKTPGTTKKGFLDLLLDNALFGAEPTTGPELPSVFNARMDTGAVPAVEPFVEPVVQPSIQPVVEPSVEARTQDVTESFSLPEPIEVAIPQEVVQAAPTIDSPFAAGASGVGPLALSLPGSFGLPGGSFFAFPGQRRRRKTKRRPTKSVTQTIFGLNVPAGIRSEQTGLILR